MRRLLCVAFFFLPLALMAQPDSAASRAVEPGMETSFDNYELLAIAVLGFLLLMGLRYWFKRSRNR